MKFEQSTWLILALLCGTRLPASGDLPCPACVVRAPAHLEILNTFEFTDEELHGASFAIDGFDGTTVWLASNPQGSPQRKVMRIDHHLRLSPLAQNVDISGYLASGVGIAATIPTYNSVRVWRQNRVSSDSYDVPTKDNIGTVSGFDSLWVDRSGTLWLRRESGAAPKGAPFLFALRTGDKQFVPVPLPTGVWESFECDTMYARSASAAYQILSDTFQLQQISSVPCSWSKAYFGITHHRSDGTSKTLQLMRFPSEISRPPSPLSFRIAPGGDAWVWAGSALCDVQRDEHVTCAPVELGMRQHSSVGFAKDGTIWFFSSFQTLVHARFVAGS